MCWERTRTFYLEGCLPVAGSTSFRYQMVCAIYLDIIIPTPYYMLCVIIHIYAMYVMCDI
jgi:hypothetical protein